MMRTQSHRWRLVPWLLAVLCIGWLSCVGHTGAARAQTAGDARPASRCSSANMPVYSADMPVSPDAYDVFVRLASPGDSAEVSVLAQPPNTPGCTRIGTVGASGDVWQYAGTWVSAGGPGGTQFVVTSSQTLGFFAVNRPQLMLVSRTNPPCQPKTECFVNIAGRQGVVRPPAVDGGPTVSLRVVNVVDPAKDTIRSVDYYIDNKPAYTKTRIEPFDLRYVGPGEHTLTTVVRYASGQQVVIADTVDHGYANQIVKYLFFSFIFGQKTWLGLSLGVVVFAIFWSCLLWMVHALYRRHLWKVMHFVKRRKAPPRTGGQLALGTQASPWHLTQTDEVSTFVWRRGIPALFVLAGILSILLLGNSFVVQPYQVEGSSMRSTLEEHNTLLVSRLGPTASKLSSKPYLPKRGEIVIFERVVEPLQQTQRYGAKIALVKRVIALPGERVTVTSKSIRVYNSDHPGGFNPDAAWADAISQEGLQPYSIDITLGPGEIFVCGDNRSQSTDSREFGPIQADSIVGKATLRLAPFTIFR